ETAVGRDADAASAVGTAGASEMLRERRDLSFEEALCQFRVTVVVIPDDHAAFVNPFDVVDIAIKAGRDRSWRTPGSIHHVEHRGLMTLKSVVEACVSDHLSIWRNRRIVVRARAISQWFRGAVS